MSLGALLSEQQTKDIEAAELRAGDRHPAWSVLYGLHPSANDCLARKAALDVLRIDALATWRRKLAGRIADLGNWHDAASAISELRVMSALLEAGLAPTPLSTGGEATPDFRIDLPEGPMVVEVFSKHEDGAQTIQRHAVAAGKEVDGVERKATVVGSRRVEMTTQVLHPGGAPEPNKPGDSVQANVISKLCSAKAKESQLSADMPGVLWLDLSNFGVMTETLLEQSQPIISGHTGLTSGALWYAFYGWKNAPIVEEGRRRPVVMGHDGRYRQQGKAKSRLSATLISFEKGVVLFENPWASRLLPETFRQACLKLPWFDLGHSIADWSAGEAEALVEIGRDRIIALAKGPRD